MEFEEFKRALEEGLGEESRTDNDSHEVGRRLADLPD